MVEIPILVSFPKRELNRAGAALREAPDTSPPQASLDVLRQWRSAHQAPLNTVQMWLRSVIRSEPRKDIIVAQRLKRAPSIIRKLKRFKTMELSTMQDIGGCRIICKDRKSIKRIVEKIKKSKAQHLRNIRNDYIIRPKDDGYRGIHIIARTKNNKPTFEHLNNFKIEIQVRTKAQHAWATAVETVDLFQKTGIKSGNQSSLWSEFFLNVSDCIAYDEDPSGTLIASFESAKSRALELYNELRVGERLEAYRETLRLFNKFKNKSGAIFVLVLDTADEKSVLRGYAFKATMAEEANQRYLEEEQRTLGDAQKDVVLVSALGIDVLTAAYPNYFLDTRNFITICRKILSA
ncbi:MAG: RelA/SpoT domain-containing protein [Roseomonas sp.]|nr:RelA/SpoT domain-containing protein [Roseomonas sp.]